ncbi:hypothetical protein NON08_07930 [Cetobacterium somerae]|uniref:hypothetical protein n=1 Tax=Cetobacterium sp. NK01 TaxID=2993530 RepID=UPI00211625BE|nr:hypothetical protein [Cetobacterium sp. NK01]MCQ8212451.1 hypothetical protein [Cetobacterium sp. NK01]
MKKIKIVYLSMVTIFFFFLSFGLLAQEVELDEAYIEIKSKALKDDFFMARYDFENDQIYIPIKGLFYFLEVYSVNLDLEKKVVDFQIDNEKYKVLIKNGKSFVIDGDLYVEIKVLEDDFKFKKSSWSSQDLKLVLEPDFILPFEIREKGKVERLRLNDKKEDDIFNLVKPEKQILAPGLLKINYSKNDLEGNGNQINLEYGTQFLYGDFYVNYSVEPESSIKNYNLTYNNVYKDNDLILGDFYIKTPDFLNINGMVEGISFGEKNTYSSTVGNITTIKGEAQGADIIELYQSGVLLDYQRPMEKNFIFEVRDRNYGGDYSLKIYYKNGQIETRKVYTVGDSKLLNEKEWSYNLQLGQEKNKRKKQSVNEVSYGLTKNLTFGLGALELESEKNRKYSMLKNEIIYKFNLSNSYPILINYQNFYEYEKQENSYEIRVNQKIKEYNLLLKHFNYSNFVAEENSIKQYNSIGISRDFLSTRIGFGYQEELKIDEKSKEKSYYISLENRSLRNFSLFLDVEVTDSNKNKKSYSINPGISYGGVSGFTMVFQANIERNETLRTDYSLKILGRRRELMSTGIEYMLGTELLYNEEEKSRFTVDFTLYLDRSIYVELPTSRREDGGINAGVTIEKTLDLSNLKRDIKDRQVDNSWIFGKVYIDSNDNGIYDDGETTLSDVALVVDGKRVVSDINGEYIISGLLPLENYKVEVDRKSIDPMLTQVIDKRKVQTRASIGTKYDVGVQAVSMVTGNINPGENVSSKELIRILSMTNVILEKNGELYQEIDPEFDGMFFFENVLPGKYEMKFKYLGNDGVKFSQDKLDVNIVLDHEDEGEYFEGYDILVNKYDQEIIKETTVQDEDEEGYNLDDILNNF